MEQKQITGLSIDEHITKIIFSDIKNLTAFSMLLLNELALKNINFRMFLQNNKMLSFIVKDDDLSELENFVDRIKGVGDFNYRNDQNLACLTIVGLGFTSSPTLSIAIINLLIRHNISVEQSSATDLSFSLLIDKDSCEQALNLIVKEFNI